MLSVINCEFDFSHVITVFKGTSPDVPNPFNPEQRNDVKNETEAKAFQPVPSGVKLGAQNAERAHIELPNINPSVPTCNFSNSQGMLRPQSENDALACLISSNYLSGYYAGNVRRRVGGYFVQECNIV